MSRTPLLRALLLTLVVSSFACQAQEGRRLLKAEDHHWLSLKVLWAGADLGMCVSWHSWHLTWQSEKYLSMCLRSEYRGKCCALVHFTGRVLCFLMDMKLSKGIPRKMQDEARDPKQNIFHFKYCYQGSKNPNVTHFVLKTGKGTV